MTFDDDHSQCFFTLGNPKHLSLEFFAFPDAFKSVIKGPICSSADLKLMSGHIKFMSI